MEVVWLCIIALLGIIAGSIIGNVLTVKRIKTRTIGRLRIDNSEADEPTRMFVELKGVTPNMIAQHEVVTFEIINESYISQK